MWSPRAQCDRNKFIWTWREILENIPNLHIWQDTVQEILVENGEVTGLTTVWGVTFRAKCVVLTAGTFLNGLMHVGRTMLPGGRMAEPASYQLTESIARHGITYGRMKTGTPVRKRRYVFSETFAAIAMAQYSIASGNKSYAEKAVKLFKQILYYKTHRAH